MKVAPVRHDLFGAVYKRMPARAVRVHIDKPGRNKLAAKIENFGCVKFVFFKKSAYKPVIGI